MLSSTDSLSLRDTNIDAMLDLEQRIRLLDSEIAPLRNKATKKLQKIEAKLTETNLLLDSSLGTADDKAALRKTKRELRERRIQLWRKLEVLPTLELERSELEREMEELQRRHGISTMPSSWHEAKLSFLLQISLAINNGIDTIVSTNDRNNDRLDSFFNHITLQWSIHDSYRRWA